MTERTALRSTHHDDRGGRSGRERGRQLAPLLYLAVAHYGAAAWIVPAQGALVVGAAGWTVRALVVLVLLVVDGRAARALQAHLRGRGWPRCDAMAATGLAVLAVVVAPVLLAL